MQFHHRIFTDQYLNLKTKDFDLKEQISAEIEVKVQHLKNWANGIISKRVVITKEEGLQADFLNLIFGEVLGYEYRQNAKVWNLAKEQKTQVDGKKADGALGFFSVDNQGNTTQKIQAVIELKDAQTDLDKPQKRQGDNRTPIQQAFDYANAMGEECKWVMVSNFLELRLYFHTDRTRYERFDFQELTESKEKLKHFFFLLYKSRLITQNLNESYTEAIYKERQKREREISDEFYQDYSQNRLLLLDYLQQQHPDIEPLILLEKTQKYLDRLIFIFFCEYLDIIPFQTLKNLVKHAQELTYSRSKTKIYDHFKEFFDAINEGFPEQNINKFNGGLFASDKVLDSLHIHDGIALKIFNKLVDYKYASDLTINVLGHIFEQSISDIEAIKKSLSGEKNGIGKRKKDGIFYTPEYITKYMVEETIGGWLEEQKQTLGFDDLPELSEADFENLTKSNKASQNTQIHLKKWQKYADTLHQIKILDPACGSGAFLNQVFDFLHQETQKIHQRIAQLNGTKVDFSELDKHILTQNLYGVDLNDESISITKLSLWLKTANRRKELTSLDDNIKVGNSLISDPEIAGNKAFDWQKEFPEVMKNGGFDIVIGNPPYGAKIPKNETEYLVKNLEKTGLSNSFSDSYVAFYGHALENLTQPDGMVAYIAPNTWRLVGTGKNFRNYLLSDKFSIRNITQHTEKVFEEATVDVDSVFIQKNESKSSRNKIDFVIGNIKEKDFLRHQVSTQLLKNQSFINLFLTQKHYDLKSKIESKSHQVHDFYDIKNGVKPYEKGKGKPAQTAETLKNKPFTSLTKIDDSFLPLLGGSQFHRYKLLWQNDYWIKYGEWLAAPRDKTIFETKEKLIFRQTSDKIIGHYLYNGFVVRNNTHILLKNEQSVLELKCLLTILNSSVVDFYYWMLNPERGEVLAEVKAFHLGLLPFPKQDFEQKPFIEKADLILSLHADLQKITTKFLNYLKADFELEKPSKKLEKWHLLDSKQFLEELKKKRIHLKTAQKVDLLEFFEDYKAQAKKLDSDIQSIDNQINMMVYELYDLTEDEIKLIENDK